MARKKKEEKEIVVEIFHCHQAKNCPYYLGYKKLEKMASERIPKLEVEVRWAKWLTISSFVLVCILTILVVILKYSA